MIEWFIKFIRRGEPPVRKFADPNDLRGVVGKKVLPHQTCDLCGRTLPLLYNERGMVHNFRTVGWDFACEDCFRELPPEDQKEAEPLMIDPYLLEKRHEEQRKPGLLRRSRSG